MTISKRLTFECWKCGETYSLLREIDEGNPILNVACPYCGAEAVVDLAPYRKKKPDSTFRGGASTSNNADVPGFTLPDVLPTRARG